MSVGTEPGLRQQLREQVATEVARWAQETERTSGRAPLLDDQQMYAVKVVNELLHQRARHAMVSGRAPLSEAQERLVRDWVLRAVSHASAPIDHLLGIPTVTDIFVNGWDDVRVRHVDGGEERVEPFAASDEQLIDIFQQLARRASSVERSWTPATPFLDLYLEGYQARVAAVAWAAERPTVAIRRHPLVDADLDDLYTRGMFDAGLQGFLVAAVRARKNVLVVGGQGSGKTTLARALAHCFGPDERLLVLESQPELHLGTDRRRHNHVVLLFERPANAEGVGGTSLADHAWHIKRQNPDRIVVGECRGGEVYPMLEAMSQGIDGSLATMHAKSTRSVFPRLVAYAHQAVAHMDRDDIYELAAEALDLIVFCRRWPDSERRVVAEVRHVERYEAASHAVRTNEIFVPGPDGAAVPNPTAPMPAALLRELVEHGYDPTGDHDVVGSAAMNAAVAALVGMGVGVGVLAVIAGVAPAPAVTRRPRRDVDTERIALVVGVGLLVLVLTRWPVAAFAGAIGAAFVPLPSELRRRRSPEAVTEALALWTEMLRDAVGTNSGLESVLAATAPAAPELIRAPVQRLAASLRPDVRLATGELNLDDALDRFAADVAHPTADLVVTALRLSSKQGQGHLAAVLSSVAAAAHSEAQSVQRVEVARQRPRSTMRLLAGIVVTFLLVLVVVSRRYLEPYATGGGQAVLAVICAYWAGAAWWMSRMTRPVRVERFLVRGGR